MTLRTAYSGEFISPPVSLRTAQEAELNSGNEKPPCPLGSSNSDRPLAVDLFAGAGGMSLGFEQAGFDVWAAVELDPVHCATYDFNFPFGSVICKNVARITGAEIRERSAISNRDLDVVFGGSPCQGFSIIGKQTTSDPRNTLIFEFARLVLELQPKFFVMENVPGLNSNKHKPLLETLIALFQAQGYWVEAQILNAAHYGVPQTRKRLFLLGSRQDLGRLPPPQPVTQLASHSPLSGGDRLPLSPTVWEAIADLPAVENYPELLERDWTQAKYGEPSAYAHSLRDANEDDYAYGRDTNSTLLTSSWRTRHTEATVRRFEKTKPGCRETTSHFDRLDPQGVSVTLRAGTDWQRGAFTAARPIHPLMPRCITVREAARLHSYPDWFRFHGTKWHGFRQVGNSVPPRLAKAIATEILRVLNVHPSKPKGMLKLGDDKLLQLTLRQAARQYQVD